MSISEQLRENIKTAMRAGDKERLRVLRMASAAIKQREVDERITLDDAQILGVLEKMIKQRRDSVEQFTKGGRDDLVAIETAEIEVLQDYLPQPLSDTEVDALIEDSIAQTGAEGMRDMGKVMAAIKAQAAGRVDMGKVSGKIKARLTG